ncbi:hypothetical protein F8A87_06520 [Betaproteobacteria bacterium SCN2]|jgi:hypothetical protein|nr:hypothetical protein F8A87_06520 [Betaproteobacteria bacterium SCN2]
MRRLIALIIMLIVPLQSAWSVALGFHGHADVNAVGVHVHDHDHHNTGHSAQDSTDASNSDGQQYSADGHHGNHCHHVFSFILHQPDTLTGLELNSEPVLHIPAAFLSRIPPLLDRPPLARA